LPSHLTPKPDSARKRRFWRFLPAAVWMAVIFILSARSGGELNSWLPWVQGMLPGLESFDPMHYAAYFVLALTLGYGFGSSAFTWRGCLSIMAVSVLYGVTDEWHQFYVPNRSPDVQDLRNDAIGAALACLLLMLYRLVRKRTFSNNYRPN
jgi:hypothetical protein